MMFSSSKIELILLVNICLPLVGLLLSTLTFPSCSRDLHFLKKIKHDEIFQLFPITSLAYKHPSFKSQYSEQSFRK